VLTPAIAAQAKREGADIVFWYGSGFRAATVHRKTWGVRGKPPWCSAPVSASRCYRNTRPDGRQASLLAAKQRQQGQRRQQQVAQRAQARTDGRQAREPVGERHLRDPARATDRVKLSREPRAAAAARAGLIATQILGLALCRYVLRLPPVVGLKRPEIVRRIGATIQAYLFNA